MAMATALTSTTLVGLAATPFDTTCPTCGQSPDHPHPAELTRRRVRDLEGQVHFLNSQAAQMGPYIPFPHFGQQATRDVSTD
jgi:hypothetical protein